MRGVGLLLLLLSCAQPPVGSDEPEEKEPQFEGGLPARTFNDEGCDGAGPSLCAWTSGLDAIVIGRVTFIEPRDDIVSFNDGSVAPRSECPGHANPALRIGIAVDDVFFGAAPAEIAVTIGPSVHDDWAPIPLVGETDIEWVGRGLENQLVVGQTLGVAAFTADGVTWAASGPLFGHDDDGAVVRQPGPLFCNEPKEFPASDEELRDALGECTTNEVAAASHDASFVRDSGSIFSACTVGRRP